MQNGTTTPRTYRAIYRLLDRVSPLLGDCGLLCGAACCGGTEPGPEPGAMQEQVAVQEPGNTPEAQPALRDASLTEDDSFGIYLLPGEEAIHDMEDPWLIWSADLAEDYEFPESWSGLVWFVRCRSTRACKRSLRPIQCRTFPLAPHLTEDGELKLVLPDDLELPYTCPLIAEAARLEDRFVRATYTAWKHLVRDPLLYDLVWSDSRLRDETLADTGARLLVVPLP